MYFCRTIIMKHIDYDNFMFLITYDLLFKLFQFEPNNTIV